MFIIIDVNNSSKLYNISDDKVVLLDEFDDGKELFFNGTNFFWENNSIIYTRSISSKSKKILSKINGKILDCKGYFILTWYKEAELRLYDTLTNQYQSIKTNFQVKEGKIGLDQTIWLIGKNQLHGGYNVLWSEDLLSFQIIPPPASAIKISGNTDGLAWTINERGEIWKLHRLGEGNTPGCQLNPSCRGCLSKNYGNAKDIGISKEGYFVVLSVSDHLKVYSDPGSNKVLHSFKGVTKFTVN